MSQCIFALQLVKCSYAKIHCGHHSCVCPVSIKYFLSPEDHSHDYCDPMTPKHSLFKIHFWHSTMCYSKVSHWHVEKINIVVDKTSSYLWHVKSQSLSGHCQCMRKAVDNWKPPKLQTTSLLELWFWLFCLESISRATSESIICCGIWLPTAVSNTLTLSSLDKTWYP